MFTITNHRLAGVPFVASPNVGGRIEPTLIVLHDTAGRLDKGSSVSWFCDRKSKVSAHLVVERDGSVTQCVPFDRAAWHAGTSQWKGRKGCNGFSIGIEIVSPGKLMKRGAEAVAWFGACWPLTQCVEMGTAAHGKGWWLRYTDAQLDTVRALIRALAAAYPTITDVAAHWEISPGRKVDTGPHFPLADMKALLADRQPLPAELVCKAQTRLAALGYWPGTVDGSVGPRTRAAVRTFQEQNGLPITGQLDDVTLGLLLSDAAQPMPAGTDPAAAVAAAESSSRDAALVKRTTEAAGGITLAATLRQVGEVVTTAESARGIGTRIGDLIAWLLTPKGLGTVATLVVCLGVWTLAHRIAKRAAPAQ